MNGTLTGPGNAEDPAVVRRQGSWAKNRCARERYAALLLPEDELVDDDFESEDDLEPDEDEESDEDDVFESDDPVDVFVAGAGLLLDDEPRLSLR
ncbi:hypothetical protein QFZ24_004331 [Streptomyces phaeochromogenes]|nr:hypothetical protein [Streptomyces phaeochromogenes]